MKGKRLLNLLYIYVEYDLEFFEFIILLIHFGAKIIYFLFSSI